MDGNYQRLGKVMTDHYGRQLPTTWEGHYRPLWPLTQDDNFLLLGAVITKHYGLTIRYGNYRPLWTVMIPGGGGGGDSAAPRTP